MSRVSFDLTLNKQDRIRVVAGPEVVLELKNVRQSEMHSVALTPSVALELGRALIREALVLEARQTLMMQAPSPGRLN